MYKKEAEAYEQYPSGLVRGEAVFGEGVNGGNNSS